MVVVRPSTVGAVILACSGVSLVPVVSGWMMNHIQAAAPVVFGRPAANAAAVAPSAAAVGRTSTSLFETTVEEDPLAGLPSLVGEALFSTDTNEAYLLKELMPVASAKKCQIYEAYRVVGDNSGGGSGGGGGGGRPLPLVLKLSANLNAIDWEYYNYQTLSDRLSPEERLAFVEVYDRIPASDQTQNRAGIVMQKGSDNLRFQIRNKGAYRGETLRKTMCNVIEVVDALHAHGLAWTELKAENFVMTEGGIIKGIDLESVVPTHDLLKVYTAEAVPPEFPNIDRLYQHLPKMIVEESFDVWGLGLVLFEMATGKPFYTLEGITDLEFIKGRLINAPATLADVHSKHLLKVHPQARALIQKCLDLNPTARPSCKDLLASPYLINQPRTFAPPSTVDVQ